MGGGWRKSDGKRRGQRLPQKMTKIRCDDCGFEEYHVKESATIRNKISEHTRATGHNNIYEDNIYQQSYRSYTQVATWAVHGIPIMMLLVASSIIGAYAGHWVAGLVAFSIFVVWYYLAFRFIKDRYRAWKERQWASRRKGA